MSKRVARKEPSDLGSLLSSVISEREWQRRLRLHQVFLFWDEVVGREVARHAQPEVIKNDVLWLSVSDSIWMQHLQFERHHLLVALNERLAVGTGVWRKGREGTPCLVDLKFQLDPNLMRRQQSQSRRRTVASAEVDQDALARFSGSLCTIDDPELREAMKRLWLAMQRARPCKVGL